MRGNCSLTVRVDDDELFGPSASGELRVGEAGYPDVVAALALAEGGDELASFAFDVDYDEDVATRRFVQGKCTPIYFHGMPMLRVTALFEGVVEKVTHTVGPLAITQHAYLHRSPAARA